MGCSLTRAEIPSALGRFAARPARKLSLIIVAALAVLPTQAARALPRGAQLVGKFQMSGRVTVAHHVPGEHVGQHVTRVWTFTPRCATAPCSSVQLVRARASGTDSVRLAAQPDGSYAGAGSFYLPLRCAGRLYPHGERVPFKITVHVTATAVVGGVRTATGISASYRNRARRNLTPCVAVLGHDAASYTGVLQPSG